MDKDDFLTMCVFVFFIILFIIYKIIIKKIGREKFYQLLYLVAAPIVTICCILNIGSLFEADLFTIIFISVIFIFMIIFWIFDLSMQINEIKGLKQEKVQKYKNDNLKIKEKIYCTNCGKEIDIKWIHCKYCGSKQE